MSVSLKELASRSGLSPSTVSQILNRRPNDFSSESTRRRVFALAEKLGYRQSFAHKVLRGDKTFTAAILLSMHRISLEEHIQELLLLLLDKLEGRDYASYLITLGSEASANLERVQDLVSRGVDYFIFIGSPVGESGIEAELLDKERNFIGYNSNMRRNLGNDIAGASEGILRYFLRRGCRNFKLLLSNANCTRSQGLFRVFPEQSPESLLRKYFVQLEDMGDHNDIDRFTLEGYCKTRELLRVDPSIQAFFYLSDYFALGGVKYLYEHGYKIGKDILVAGFNNIHAVRNHVFPIISAKHDIEEISNIIIAQTNKSEVLERNVKVKLIIRED